MDNLKLLTKDCYNLLVKNNLLESLVKAEIINSIISDKQFDLNDSQRKQIKQVIIDNERIQSEEDYNNWLKARNVTEEKVLEDMSKPLKLDQYCLNKYSHMAESRFLKNKNKLDQVTYSLIRVNDMYLAQELYLRISENPLLFSELSSQYSQGHERSSKGIIGPISFTKGHPGLMDILRRSQVGEVNQPFRLDNIWVVTRLEALHKAKLDENTKKHLCKEIFQEWLKKSIKEKIEELHKKLTHEKFNE